MTLCRAPFPGPQCLSVDLAAAHQLLAARMCAGAGAAAGARGGAAAAPAETPLARSLLAIRDPQELNKKCVQRTLKC